MIRPLLPDASVFGLDRSFKGEGDFVEVPCDLRDEAQTERVVLEIHPDYIFHLAGLGQSDSWDELFAANVKTTVSILKASKKLPRSDVRIVVIGSAAEYGLVSLERLPVEENALPNPGSLYGASMCSRTAVALAYANAGLHVVVARVFNLLGAGLPEYLSVGSFASQIAAIEADAREPIVSTGQLAHRRDFVDVDDAARALYLLSLHAKAGEIYNVCSGASVAIGDVLQLMLRESTRNIAVRSVPSRAKPFDVPDMRGSGEKILRQTGWEPTVSIEEAALRTLVYYRGLKGVG